MTAIAGLHEECAACWGDGGAFTPAAWVRCTTCDGFGYTFVDGAPRFGATSTLGEHAPGVIVSLATGRRARVAWHEPRPTKRTAAVTTFVDLLDAADARVSGPHSYPSVCGVFSAALQVELVDDDHAHDKDTDALDPLARQQRATTPRGDDRATLL